MTQLFWKSFFIIWLALLASVVATFVISAGLRSDPLQGELDRHQRIFSLDTAARLIHDNGEDAAVAFIKAAAIATPPVNMSISATSPSGDCTAAEAPDVRQIAVSGKCYVLTVQAQQFSLLARGWPKLFPWFTALLASLLGAYSVARYLIQPVDLLKQGLSALANGRFDVRIGDRMAGRRDEVATLAHDFDVSATRLQELQSSQQRLFHDVSHELRSPLSRLQAALGVLRQNPSKLTTLADRMNREIERMDNLVEEILTLARVSAGPRGNLKSQSLDIVDLLNEILGDAVFEGQSRGVALQLDLPKTFVAEVNGELIYRAIENVVRNALKYTRENSTVTVGGKVEGDILRIAIADEGPGVPIVDLEQIFRPFSRSENAVAPGGFGLGLAIAKHAVEIHGGRISARPAASGGLQVLLEIPRNHYI